MLLNFFIRDAAFFTTSKSSSDFSCQKHSNAWINCLNISKTEFKSSRIQVPKNNYDKTTSYEFLAAIKMACTYPFGSLFGSYDPIRATFSSESIPEYWNKIYYYIGGMYIPTHNISY